MELAWTEVLSVRTVANSSSVCRNASVTTGRSTMGSWNGSAKFAELRSLISRFVEIFKTTFPVNYWVEISAKIFQIIVAKE